MSEAAEKAALLDLLAFLDGEDYRFVTPTPCTHERVLARDPGAVATDLRGAFGWNLPFLADLLPGRLFDRLAAVDALAPEGVHWKSRFRVASLADRLFLHSAFPTDDPEGPAPPEAPDVAGASAALPTVEAAAAGAAQVDAMILWTPSAEAAAGGRAAMDSLALASVANANLVYANSGINAQVRLVYAGSVSFTESPLGINNDLAALRGTTDGKMDQVHSLRAQYGADLVTLIGEGYRTSGTCGIA